MSVDCRPNAQLRQLFAGARIRSLSSIHIQRISLRPICVARQRNPKSDGYVGLKAGLEDREESESMTTRKICRTTVASGTEARD